MVERVAKILCPVRTGTLKRSITHKFVGKNDAQVGSNIEYAPHVELGTVKWSGKPFLRPALHQCLPDIKRLLGAK
jgi:phage gpG-like protein